MELCSIQKTPPEKYYEACITYHLVRYFEDIYNRRLYPFSISQVREKQLGFDFGYEAVKGNVFLAQYKRPIGKGKRGLLWEIDREQAEVLVKVPARTFYVLPAFMEQEEWYEGLEKTFFVPAGQVWNWMQGRRSEKCAWLHQDEKIVAEADRNAFDPFGADLNSAVLMQSRSMERVFKAVAAEGICGYWIGGVITDGAWQLFQPAGRKDLSEFV